MMAFDGSAETVVLWKTLDHGQRAREEILITNYLFVVDNVGHIIKSIPSPYNYHFHLQKITPVSYTHLDVYKRQY